MPELWNQLHDATLTSIHLDWATGMTTLELRTELSSAPAVAIIAEGTVRLTCPRKCPWGESVSINEVRGPKNIGDQAQLEIEMQSGDVLELEACSAICVPRPHPQPRAR